MSETDVSPAKARALLIDEYACRCQYCGKEHDPRLLEVEHIHPRSKGGDDSLENYTLACYGCNRKKAVLLLPEPGLSLLVARAIEVAHRILRKLEHRQAVQQARQDRKTQPENPASEEEKRQTEFPADWGTFTDKHAWHWGFPMPVPWEAIWVYGAVWNNPETIFWKEPSRHRYERSRVCYHFWVNLFAELKADETHRLLDAASEWWSRVQRANDYAGWNRCALTLQRMDFLAGKEVYAEFSGEVVPRGFLQHVSMLAGCPVPALRTFSPRDGYQRPARKADSGFAHSLLDSWESGAPSLRLTGNCRHELWLKELLNIEYQAKLLAWESRQQGKARSRAAGSAGRSCP